MSIYRWHCHSCRRSGFTPVERRDFEQLSTYCGQVQAHYILRDCCPHCDSSDIEEQRLCAECFETKAHPNDDLCDPCRARENQAEMDFWLDARESPVDRREWSSLGYRRAS